ncbi:glycosyltransferase family 1 protein, partial [Geodermatophilus sp. DF01-2]
TGLLADPARARRLAAAGTRQAATWPDEAATARQLVALYRELLGSPGGGPR